MTPKRPSPIEGYAPFPILLRFCSAAFFGILIDLLLFILLIDSLPFDQTWPWIILVSIPFVWGIIGIFYLQRILCYSKSILDQIAELYTPKLP